MPKDLRLILTADVTGLGSAGSEVMVAVPYAQRVLLPQKLAVLATVRERARVTKEQTKKSADVEAQRKAATRTLAAISGKSIMVPVKASGSKLYGSAGVKDIVAAVKTGLGVALDPSWIVLPKPITSLGDHKVEIRCQDLPPVTLTLTLTAKK
jgi:large subunit ribosomal protein L9